ncbi:MAG: phosphatase PAP2 family protein [Rhodopseudomonas sp.]|nr:phosphatase PAP2 family protein [Rhodopseudomonas sp.]
MTMLLLNHHIFLLLNASASPSPLLVDLADFVAQQLIYAIPVLLLALWIWGRPERRAGLISTTVAAGCALGANQMVGLLWYEPRPFMIGLGHTLVAHVPENSFPSDHTTFFLTVGFALIATRGAPGFGKLVSLIGVLVAWARIYLGLHYPVDMITSALIACLFGTGSILLNAPVCRWIAPTINRIYEATLDVLRLPIRIFPRTARSP